MMDISGAFEFPPSMQRSSDSQEQLLHKKLRSGGRLSPSKYLIDSHHSISDVCASSLAVAFLPLATAAIRHTFLRRPIEYIFRILRSLRMDTNGLLVADSGPRYKRESPRAQNPPHSQSFAMFKLAFVCLFFSFSLALPKD
jgi:hypothetical protein